MSRPKPNILLDYTDPKNFKSEQVLEATAIYAVFYDGKPINIRNVNSIVNFPGPKYKKIAFTNSGHAFNLSERLNNLFKTNKFEVYELSNGKKIDQESPS